MVNVICTSCHHENRKQAENCAACGAVLPKPVAPIRKLSGKFSAIGVVVIALGVIGTVLGTWWGPPTILPGVAFYMMGRFF
ncbi:MAG: hypothetical protein RLZ25_1236 [Pseudomonadota bacterium]|jgi:hypothetical protein